MLNKERDLKFFTYTLTNKYGFVENSELSLFIIIDKNNILNKEQSPNLLANSKHKHRFVMAYKGNNTEQRTPFLRIPYGGNTPLFVLFKVDDYPNLDTLRHIFNLSYHRNDFLLGSLAEFKAFLGDDFKTFEEYLTKKEYIGLNPDYQPVYDTILGRVLLNDKMQLINQIVLKKNLFENNQGHEINHHSFLYLMPEEQGQIHNKYSEITDIFLALCFNFLKQKNTLPVKELESAIHAVKHENLLNLCKQVSLAISGERNKELSCYDYGSFLAKKLEIIEHGEKEENITPDILKKGLNALRTLFIKTVLEQVEPFDFDFVKHKVKEINNNFNTTLKELYEDVNETVADNELLTITVLYVLYIVAEYHLRIINKKESAFCKTEIQFYSKNCDAVMLHANRFFTNPLHLHFTNNEKESNFRFLSDLINKHNLFKENKKLFSIEYTPIAATDNMLGVCFYEVTRSHERQSENVRLIPTCTKIPAISDRALIETAKVLENIQVGCLIIPTLEMKSRGDIDFKTFIEFIYLQYQYSFAIPLNKTKWLVFFFDRLKHIKEHNDTIKPNLFTAKEQTNHVADIDVYIDLIIGGLNDYATNSIRPITAEYNDPTPNTSQKVELPKLTPKKSLSEISELSTPVALQEPLNVEPDFSVKVVETHTPSESDEPESEYNDDWYESMLLLTEETEESTNTEPDDDQPIDEYDELDFDETDLDEPDFDEPVF